MAIPTVGGTVTTAISGTGGTSSPLTASHTTDISTNLLIICTHYGSPSSSIHATNVTFDGNALTELATIEFGNDTRSDLWYLVAPDIKAATVSVGTFGGVARISWTAINIIGANQSTPFGAAATGSDNSSNSITVSASSSLDDLVIATCCFKLGAGAAVLTSGTGITEHSNDTHPNAVGGVFATGTKVGANGLVAMDWSVSKSNDWTEVVVSIQPLAVTATLQHKAHMLGLTAAQTRASLF